MHSNTPSVLAEWSTRTNDGSGMLRYPNVLLFSNDEGETATLQQLLSEHVVLTPVNNLSELASLHFQQN